MYSSVKQNVKPVRQHKARFSPKGDRDYFGVLDDLLAQRAGRENRFMDEFEAASSRLELFPEMGLERSDLGVGLRSIQIWSYLVFYTVSDTEIVFERIVHGARDFAILFDED